MPPSGGGIRLVISDWKGEWRCPGNGVYPIAVREADNSSEYSPSLPDMVLS